MYIRAFAGLAIALLIPMKGYAQEAFITQISTSSASFAISSPAVSTNAQQVIQSLETPSLNLQPLNVDTSAYPIIGAPITGPVASVTSIGNSNSSLIMQTGLQSASIYQVGDGNAAAVVQAGSGNQASVYQTTSLGTASMFQSGQGNSALIVQR